MGEALGKFDHGKDNRCYRSIKRFKLCKTIIQFLTNINKGIGLAITVYLLEHGHNVVATARSGHLLKDLLPEYTNKLVVISGNITNPNIAYNILETAAENFGQIDGLIINQGTLDPVTRIADSKVDDWKKCFDVNFFSAVSLVSCHIIYTLPTDQIQLEVTLPALRSSKGRIIFTSSGAARHSYIGWGAYSASKSALKSLSDTIALEEPGIITISVEPGTVDTTMQKEIREKHVSGMDEKEHQRFMSLYEDGKLASPEGPGHLIANLILKATKELNGQTFR